MKAYVSKLVLFMSLFPARSYSPEKKSITPNRYAAGPLEGASNVHLLAMQYKHIATT
jgi:hypothetical protein